MYPILIIQTRTKQPILIFEFIMIKYIYTHTYAKFRNKWEGNTETCLYLKNYSQQAHFKRTSGKERFGYSQKNGSALDWITEKAILRKKNWEHNPKLWVTWKPNLKKIIRNSCYNIRDVIPNNNNKKKKKEKKSTVPLIWTWLRRWEQVAMVI